MQEKSINIGKHKVFYKEFGRNKKQTLLILHGWGGTSDSWKAFSSLLQDNYYIISPDLPGFGKTEMQENFTLEKYAELIEEFALGLGLTDIYLLGHSNGGAIASVIASRRIILIRKLILNNSAGIRNDKKRWYKRKILKMLSFGKYFPGYKVIRPYFHKYIGVQDYTNSEENKYLLQTYQNMISSDLQNIFPKIDIEVLMLWGEKDTYTPLSDANIIKELLPNVTMRIIYGEKHGIHLSSPEKLKKYFLENM